MGKFDKKKTMSKFENVKHLAKKEEIFFCGELNSKLL